MLNAFFVNAAILVSAVYLSSLFFKNTTIGFETVLRTTLSVGVVLGLAGCLLMFNGIHFSNNVLFDFRAFALMCSVIFCGPLAGGITALFIMLFRAGFFGLTHSTLIAMINLVFLLLCFTFIYKARFAFRMKYIHMTTAHITTSLIIMHLLMPTNAATLAFALQYLAASVMVAVALYFVLAYIFKTNELYRRLQRESTRDSLTGLYNVRAFDLFLNKSSDAAVEKNMPLSLLMVDIDFFKKVNDTYGHASGDLVLKQLSQILAYSCRSHDFISRNGGEEFTVILVDCDDQGAFVIAERIRKNVEKSDFYLSDHEKIKITVSIGVSTYPITTASPAGLLQEADGALYHAKRSGRNVVKDASVARSDREVQEAQTQ